MTKANTTTKVSTAKLQLEFETSQYEKIQTTATEENNRKGLVKRKEKIHTYQAIHLLIDQGLQFRKGEVYVPADKLSLLMKDEKFSKLLAKAQLANEELRQYQDKLLS